MNDAVAMDDLSRAMARRGSPMPLESALFILLQAVEAMRAQIVVLDAGGIEIDGDGVVRINELCSPTVDDREVQEGVANVFEMTLGPVADASDLLPRLRGETTLTHAALVAELSAALVPLNRGAAQRMLGRLVREHYRPAREKAEAEAARAAAEPPPTESMIVSDDLAPAPEAAVVQKIVEDMKADATLPDAKVRLDWEEPEPKKKGPSTVQALVALALAMALLGLAVMFVWGRLHHR